MFLVHGGVLGTDLVSVTAYGETPLDLGTQKLLLWRQSGLLGVETEFLLISAYS